MPNPNSARKAVSKSIRFEVFKRDAFACRYCGRKPPEVLLEVDHVIALVNGGDSDLGNLLTACAACNRGKGARPLGNLVAPFIDANVVDDLAERLEQSRAYAELVQQREALTRDWAWMIWEKWTSSFGGDRVNTDSGVKLNLPSGERFPDEATVLRFIRRLPLDEIFEAIEVCAAKFNRADQNACRYFYGICWSKIRESGE